MDIRKYFNKISDTTLSTSSTISANAFTSTNANSTISASANSTANASANAFTSTNKTAITNKSVIEIFTDGSTFNNGKKNKLQFGGVGIYFNDNIYPSISEPLYGKITNNIAELKAIIIAIDFVINHKDFKIENTKIHIYSDSEYTINCIIKWSKNWEKNGWKKRDKKEISNKDLIIKLYNYYKKYDIKLIHVNAHKEKPKNKELEKIWYGNMMADKLATNASKKSKEEFYNLKGVNSKSKSFFPSAILP